MDWNGESLQVGGLPERESTKSQLTVINGIIIGIENCPELRFSGL